jgi:hypothetical protein
LSTGAKEVFGALKVSSKEMLDTVMEKVGQSEVVQNATDRFGVAENKIGKWWAGMKVKGAEAECQKAREGVTSQQAAKEEILAVRGKYIEMLKTINEEGPSAENEEDHKNDVAEVDQKIREAEINFRLKEGALDKKKERVTEYESSILEAKKNLDGRLTAKMDINSKAIEEQKTYLIENSAELDRDTKALENAEEAIKALQKFVIAEKPTGATLKSLQEKLQTNKDSIISLNKNIARLKFIRSRLKNDLREYEGKNAKLQAKRDKFFPPLEKAQAGGSSQESGEIDREPDRTDWRERFGEEQKGELPAGEDLEEIGPDEEIDLEEAKAQVKEIDKELKTASGEKAKELEMRGIKLEKLIHKKERVGVEGEPDTVAEKEKQHNLGEVVAKWNRFLRDIKIDGKERSKLVIRLDKTQDDPSKDLRDSDEILRELKTRLAKNLAIEAKALPLEIKYKLYDFLRELNEGNLNY